MISNGVSLFEIQMPSDASECSRLRKVVSQLTKATLHDSHAVKDVELAVGEAFGNAVKHGSDKNKVSVRLEALPRTEVAVEMVYASGAFNTAVTYPQNVLEGTGGFGRYIMNKVLDSMEYVFSEDGRTTLRMIRRRH